jgi:hypothetical protein
VLHNNRNTTRPSPLRRNFPEHICSVAEMAGWFRLVTNRHRKYTFLVTEMAELLSDCYVIVLLIVPIYIYGDDSKRR